VFRLLSQVLKLVWLSRNIWSFQLRQSSKNEEVTLRQRELFIGFVADEDVVEVGYSFEFGRGLAEVDIDFGVAERWT